ncbi:MAG: acylneuraminate cytidylyltransferase family protein [Sulfurimonas sp.]|nr:acylneuraminate cytidylyltransferase family protein [Sulfurimonas sp.]
MKILALIPARGGSKGVPKKNIKLLEDYPLIAYTIAAAKASKNINKVLVSTDFSDIRDIALDFGAEVPFLRPNKIAGEKSQDIDYVLHALEYLEKEEDYIPDLIVLLRVTTPLREVQYIDEAIEKLILDTDATSLRSSHLAAESPFKWFCTSNGYYTPISDASSLEDANKPRQSFKNIYIPNGYVDILKVKQIKINNSLYGEKILAYITPNGYEIDTMEEFEYIQYLIQRHGSDLLEFLKKENI